MSYTYFIKLIQKTSLIVLCVVLCVVSELSFAGPVATQTAQAVQTSPQILVAPTSPQILIAPTHLAVKTVLVPQLIGLQRDQAIALLKRSNLQWKILDTVSDRTPGIVINQKPRAGSKVIAGSVVQLAVSKQRSVGVPQLIGLQRDKAITLLKRLNFQWKVLDTVSDRTPGIVIDQKPRAGSKVIAGSVVQLAVSKQRVVSVPQLIGLQRDKAITLLKRLNFQWRTLDTESDRTPGIVIDQKPGANSKAVAGSVVQLAVSKQRMVSIPSLVGLGENQAFKILSGLKLRWSIQRQIADGEPGIVINQSPAPKKQVVVGFVVKITVSKQGLHSVPQLVGMQRDKAIALLQRLNFQWKVLDTVSDRTPGIVIDQKPGANSKAVAGSVVQLTVSKQRMVSIPSLVGLDENQAFKILSGLKLRWSIQRQIADGEPGIVINQSPSPKKQVAVGFVVKITVSKQRMVNVPQLIGLEENQAVDKLTGLNFKRNLQRRVADSPPGIVIDQEPQADAQVVAGATIQVTVSEQIMVPVPKLVGLREQEAINELNRVKLKENIQRKAAEGLPGIVIEQEPQADAQVVAGTIIRFVVSKAIIPAPTPDPAPGQITEQDDQSVPVLVWAIAALLLAAGLGAAKIYKQGKNTRLKTVSGLTYKSGLSPTQDSPSIREISDSDEGNSHDE